MLEGLAWALLAGVMLGLYALPEKFTKNFHYQNTWGLFFFVTMFIVPLVASYLLLGGVQIFGMVSFGILLKIMVASFLWGIGVVLWGKAINHIGLSLGFSLFIGTVILIGSLIPWFINSSGQLSVNVPESVVVLGTILVGLVVVLFGVVFIGKAGLMREKDAASNPSAASSTNKLSMLKGIAIAVIGGILATAFSYSNAVGIGPFREAAIALGLEEWKAAVAVMNVIYVSGGVVAVLYFSYALTKEDRWTAFSVRNLVRNLHWITAMSLLNFAASVAFSYAASELGPAAGKTVGYAIFNAMSILTATLCGLLVGEWRQASSKSMNSLWTGLASMLTGIIIISIGNGLG